MSGDEDSYDPNANVPAWVNIVVPIATVVIFLAVIILLWRTDKEVSTGTIKRTISKTPFLNKCTNNEETTISETFTTTSSSKDPLLCRDSLTFEHDMKCDYGAVGKQTYAVV